LSILARYSSQAGTPIVSAELVSGEDAGELAGEEAGELAGELDVLLVPLVALVEFCVVLLEPQAEINNPHTVIANANTRLLFIFILSKVGLILSKNFLNLFKALT
jgi:hypothetical protein